MEILKYSKEHKQFRQRVRAFMEKEIIPFVDQWEKDRIMPRAHGSGWEKKGFYVLPFLRSTEARAVIFSIL